MVDYYIGGVITRLGSVSAVSRWPSLTTDMLGITVAPRKRNPLNYYTCHDCGVTRKRKLPAKGPAKRFCNACTRKPENWVHGEANTYNYWGCRCRKCKDAVLLKHNASLENYEKNNGVPYEFKYKTWYNRVCASDTCYDVFRTTNRKVKYCSVSCSSRQIRINERRSKTVPVIYDPVFASFQQTRLNLGLHYSRNRPRHWISDDDRLRFYIEFNFTCQDCGSVCDSSTTRLRPSIDHILPWVHFYNDDPLRDDWSNLILLCHYCNSVKQDKFVPRAWISLLVRCGDMSITSARALRKAKVILP